MYIIILFFMLMSTPKLNIFNIKLNIILFVVRASESRPKLRVHPRPVPAIDKKIGEVYIPPLNYSSISPSNSASPYMLIHTITHIIVIVLFLLFCFCVLYLLGTITL